MDKFDRIFQLHAILSARRTPMPLEDLMARLECSRATLYRAVTALKDRVRVIEPIELVEFIRQELTISLRTCG